MVSSDFLGSRSFTSSKNNTEAKFYVSGEEAEREGVPFIQETCIFIQNGTGLQLTSSHVTELNI